MDRRSGPRPVIWATQVLEHLAQKGTPSRSEMTDAAMAARAECVMLNKGPYLLDAIDELHELLQRMAESINARKRTAPSAEELLGLARVDAKGTKRVRA